MSQCVPSWDLDRLDYKQVAELTWKNGQLTMHGLGASRLPTTTTTMYVAWDKPRAAGTLESLVDQATSHQYLKSDVVDNNSTVNVNELAPAVTVAMDALVPCSNNISTNIIAKNSNVQYKNNTEKKDYSDLHFLGCSALVGSCGSAVDGGGPTSTSLRSLENTSSGGEYTRTSAEDHDSACHSRSQREVQAVSTGDRKRKAIGKCSVPTKSRAAAIHNQSERKRRDKINQRMKTLQKMVPNSSKTDKASMLDEVIEYLKQLQAQVHMMSRLNMVMQQQLQMSVMDINAIARTAGMQPGGFVPSWDIHGGSRPQQQAAMMLDLLSAYLACQSQPNPMTIDAYSKMAAMYQQELIIENKSRVWK